MYTLGPAPTTREGWVLVAADKAASVVDLAVYAARLLTGQGLRTHRMLRRIDPFVRRAEPEESLAPAA